MDGSDGGSTLSEKEGSVSAGSGVWEKGGGER